MSSKACCKSKENWQNKKNINPALESALHLANDVNDYVTTNPPVPFVQWHMISEVQHPLLLWPQ